MKKFAAVLLSLALALSLCACGGGGQEETKAPDTGSENAAETAGEEAAQSEAAAPSEEDGGILGVYRLTQMTSASEDAEEEDALAALEAMGLKAFLAVQEDGEATLEMFGEQLAMKYDEQQFYSVNEDGTVDEEEPTTYTYADGILTMMDKEGQSMEFTKLTEEELADYQENGSGSIEDLLNNLSSISGFVPDIPEGEPSDGPVSGEIDGCAVTIVGAESFEEGGKNYIRFHYDFTNGGEEAASPFMTLYINAIQDGETLASSFVEENSIPEDENLWEDLEPGGFIRATEIYEFNPDGGTVGVRFADEDGEDVILYYVDPQNLPGAPVD